MKIIKMTDLITEGISPKELRSYLETALWSSDGGHPNGSPLDDEGYTIRDFSKKALNNAKRDLNKFYQKAKKLLEDEKEVHWAHDFWLTRNGHGAGFWDGDYEHGDELTKIAEKFGSVDLYVGDDGKIYD